MLLSRHFCMKAPETPRQSSGFGWGPPHMVEHQGPGKWGETWSNEIVPVYPLVNLQKAMENHHF